MIQISNTTNNSSTTTSHNLAHRRQLASSMADNRLQTHCFSTLTDHHTPLSLEDTIDNISCRSSHQGHGKHLNRTTAD